MKSRALRLLSLLALLGLSVVPAAQGQASDPPLVYVFVMDGVDGDNVDEGISTPFLSSLVRGGVAGARTTYFQESRAIMIAETNPNHVAMATGAYGERSGIPGNGFAVYGKIDNADSCPALPDESTPAQTASGESPDCLQAQTFFQALGRDAAAGDIVTAGIFGKPKLSRIFAGKEGDRFTADYLWTPCTRPSAEVPYCKQVPNRFFDEYSIADGTVMDEVIRTVNEGVAGDGKTFNGKGRRPNLTFVNLPGVDSAGHGTGADGAYDAQTAVTDREIQRFVDNQKAQGLWGRTVMLVVSDHTVDSTPNRTSLGQRFGADGVPSTAYRIVQNGSAAFVYLNDRRSPGRFDVLKRLRAAALATPGQGMAGLLGTPAIEALYREANPADGGEANTVTTKRPAWRLTGPRVGDLVVTIPSGNTFSDPVNPLPGNHGGSQTRDSAFLVTGGSPLVKQGTITGVNRPDNDDSELNPQQAESVDVAPTVLRLLGRAPAEQNQGRFLEEAFDLSRLPALGAAVKADVPAAAAQTCAVSSAFRSAGAKGRGTGVRFRFSRRAGARSVKVDVLQQSAGRRILGNRLAARFTGRTRSFTWSGRGRGGRRLSDGYYVVRFTARAKGGRTDVRRAVLERRGGRFVGRPDHYRRVSCGTLSSFKLERPVFGGRSNRPLGISYRLTRPGRVGVTLLRGSRTVRTLSKRSSRSGNRTFRLRLAPERLGRGRYRIRVSVRSGRRTVTALLTAKRL